MAEEHIKTIKIVCYVFSILFVVLTSFLIINLFSSWFSDPRNEEIITKKNISIAILNGTISSNNTVIEDTMNTNKLYINQNDKISFFIVIILTILGFLLAILIHKYVQLV